ncbi:MAG: 50S ribosomal protein L3 [Chloroflexi bacterium]|nr:50S ribosomal protein L3 [Chloroflexota bacterium]
MISGLLGKKVGVTQFFRPDGTLVAATAIEAGPCTITQIRTTPKDGYEGVQVGFGQRQRLNQPQRGHLKASGSSARHLREFAATDYASLKVGQRVDVSIFQRGDFVQVAGVSKGRGFQGGVKRYHFKGGPKTHGQSDRHRGPGSVGSTTTPGHVMKGLRMAGHMGHERVTVRNLRVLEADPQRNLLLVQGAVPGPNGGLLEIMRAKRPPRAKQAPPAPAKK